MHKDSPPAPSLLWLLLHILRKPGARARGCLRQTRANATLNTRTPRPNNETWNGNLSRCQILAHRRRNARCCGLPQPSSTCTSTCATHASHAQATAAADTTAAVAPGLPTATGRAPITASRQVPPGPRAGAGYCFMSGHLGGLAERDKTTLLVGGGVKLCCSGPPTKQIQHGKHKWFPSTIFSQHRPTSRTNWRIFNLRTELSMIFRKRFRGATKAATWLMGVSRTRSPRLRKGSEGGGGERHRLRRVACALQSRARGPLLSLLAVQAATLRACEYVCGPVCKFGRPPGGSHNWAGRAGTSRACTQHACGGMCGVKAKASEHDGGSPAVLPLATLE